MNKHILITLLIGLSVCFSSCDEIIDRLGTDDVVNGLKTALEVGTDSTVTTVSKVGGYFKDEAIKILLPEEAQTAVNLINNSTIAKTAITLLGYNFDETVSNTVKALNTAAEESAKSAAPIFKSAITGLSISDGWSIVKGQNPANTNKSASEAFDSTAATGYLRAKTYEQLVKAYGTPVNNALSSTGTTEIWSTFTGAVNTIVETAETIPFVGTALPIESINTNLGEYVTGKALDGLFLKVGDVEKKIRKDPFGWAAQTGKDILSRVFGSN